MSADYGRIVRDGVWDNNIVFAQALGLCPLLAVTGTASNGLGMGLATTAVMIAAAVIISVLRGIITPQVRIPVFVLIIAVLVTLVDLSTLRLEAEVLESAFGRLERGAEATVRFAALPDETRGFPAHGAGSACGKNLSTETSSTMGEQRRSNYALLAPDRASP